MATGSKKRKVVISRRKARNDTMAIPKIIQPWNLPNVHSHITIKSLEAFITFISSEFTPAVSKQ